MIAYLLEAIGGTVLVALAAYCTWHEERLIALEERIAKTIKERINCRAIGKNRSNTKSQGGFPDETI